MHMSGHIVMAAALLVPVPFTGDAQHQTCLRDALGTLRCIDGSQIRTDGLGVTRDAEGILVYPYLTDPPIVGPPPPTTAPRTDVLGRPLARNGLPCLGRGSMSPGCP